MRSDEAAGRWEEQWQKRSLQPLTAPDRAQASPQPSETRLLVWPPAHAGPGLLVFCICSLRSRLNFDEKMISNPYSTVPPGHTLIPVTMT